MTKLSRSKNYKVGLMLRKAIHTINGCISKRHGKNEMKQNGFSSKEQFKEGFLEHTRDGGTFGGQ